MTRAITSTVTKAKHRKILKLAKGYRGRSKNCYRIALQRVEKALQYAYRDRRKKKIDFRGLWIQRINAAVRQYGMTYSKFIHMAKIANIELDRKILADLAVRNPESFKTVVQQISRSAEVAQIGNTIIQVASALDSEMA
jgi:large subunit ribosomal protein L20